MNPALKGMMRGLVDFRGSKEGDSVRHPGNWFIAADRLDGKHPPLVLNKIPNNIRNGRQKSDILSVCGTEQPNPIVLSLDCSFHVTILRLKFLILNA